MHFKIFKKNFTVYIEFFFNFIILHLAQIITNF